MNTPSSWCRALGLLSASVASSMCTALILQNSPCLSTRELWLVDGQDRVRARLGLDGCDSSPSLAFCAPGRLEETRLRIGLTWLDSPEIQLFGTCASPDRGSVLTISNHGLPATPLLQFERHADTGSARVDFRLGLGVSGPTAGTRDSQGRDWENWP